MKGKVVVITGASSGIGRALAGRCAQLGAGLVLASRRIGELNRLKDDLKQSAAGVIAVETDVSVESDCANMVQAAVEHFGRIDVLINNAGISMRALFDDVELDVVRKLMDVNFWGAVHCTKHALPYLLESKGSLVGVSSIAGYKGLPGRTGYSSSKFALQGFLEVLRIENLKKDLHVLIACPGFTESNIRNAALTADGSPQGTSPREESKMMTSEEVAGRIIKAIRKRRDRLTLTTEGKLLVMINKFFPRLADRIVYKNFAKEKDAPIE